MTTLQAILTGLQRLDDRPALQCGEQQWTGARLLDLAGRMTTALRKLAPEARLLQWTGGDLPEVLPLRLAAMWAGLGFTTAPPAEAAAARLTLSAAELPALAEFPAAAPAEATGVDCAVVRGRWTWSAETYRRSLATLRDAFGDLPTRTAVLAPPTGFGGDAALVSWSLATPVYCLPCLPGTDKPAKLLSLLERVEPDCVVLPLALLRTLLAHPAAALADLRELRRIVVEAEGAGAMPVAEAAGTAFGAASLSGLAAGDAGLLSVEHDRQRLAQAAQRIAGRVRQLPGVAAAEGVAAEDGRCTVFAVPATVAVDAHRAWVDQVVAGAIDVLETDFAGVVWPQAIAAIEQLGRAALLSMLNGLYRCGLFADTGASHTVDEVLAKARVAAEHRPLLRRWLRVLAEQGLLRREGEQLRVVPPAADYADAALARAWNEVEAAWQASVGSAGTIEYARRNAERLPELIRGTAQAVHLLFPQGRTDLARALYRESLPAQYQHRAVRALVSRIARDWPAQAGHGRPLRVLEVGAGTGATSEALLPALAGLPVDYLYTDVSRYFIDQAAPRLTGHPAVRFGLYDIDRPPRDQGFLPNSFDVVIGGGVLNAARNTDASVRWLAELLSPGGWLVLTEPTVEEFWVMASQAFMLANASDGRAETEATFLTLPQWNQVLDNAGLQRVLGLPGAGHPLEKVGHRVFAARAKTDRAPLHPAAIHEHLQRDGGPNPPPLRIEIVDALSLPAATARAQPAVHSKTASA